MKVTTRVVMAFGLVLMGATCFAADASSAKVESKETVVSNQHAVDVSKVRRDQKLRAWVDSIKPAAGAGIDTKSTHPANEYWRQSVRRENRGAMQE